MRGEVRMSRYLDGLHRYRTGAWTCAQAAEFLGISERHFRRLRDRYDAEGAEGLIDRRRERNTGRGVPVDRIEFVLAQYRTRYFDLSVKHFHDVLRAEHGFEPSYSWTKSVLQHRGLVPVSSKRGPHRRKRERKAAEGMMLHQDGSRHAWLFGQRPLDLIVTMDDATSTIYSAFLVEEEGTASSLRGLREVFMSHGLPCSLYTDRGSHYFITPEAGGKVDKTHLTQVGRALKQLGIEHIAAYSPQARGRSERMFATLQDRLVKELKLAGITDVETANRWIAEVYLPRHNALFAKPAALPEKAFVPVRDKTVLVETLCIEEERVVARDNTVSYDGLTLQIEKSAGRAHYVKANVKVRSYPDETLGIFHGPLCIGRYHGDGSAFSVPAHASLAPCSTPSRRGLPTGEAAEPPGQRPALTASARGARAKAWAGTEKRAVKPNIETDMRS